MMRILLLAGFGLWLAAAPALAGQVGALPRTEEVGRVDNAVGVFFHDAEWQTDSDNFEDGRVQQARVFLQASYQLSQRWRGHLRAGGADLRMDNVLALEASDFSGDVRPYLGAGLSGWLYRQPNWGVGLFGQASYFAKYLDRKKVVLSGQPVSEKLEIKHFWEVACGVQAQVQLGPVDLYGGPALYASGAKLLNQAEGVGIVERTTSATFHDQDNFGGLLGAALSWGDWGQLALETQLRGRLSFGGLYAYLRLGF